MTRSTRGFTLTELVIVIVIIGLLAAVVVPKLVNITGEAKEAAEDGTVAAIRSGIELVRMETVAKGGDPNASYPTTLDSAKQAAASESNPLFTEVLEHGLTDENWEKSGSTSYTYVPTKAVYVYDGKTGDFKAKTTGSVNGTGNGKK